MSQTAIRPLAGPVLAPGAPAAALAATAWRRRYRRRVVITDVAVVSVAAAHGGTLFSLVRVDGAWQQPAVVALVVALGWLVMLQLFGTRSAREFAVGAGEYKRVIHASATVAGLYATVALLVGDAGGRYFLLVAFPAGTLGLLAGRWAWRVWLGRMRSLGHALSDVVVVGQPDDVRYVVTQLRKNCGAAYKAVGVVLDGEEPAADAPAVASARTPASAAVDDVPRFAGTHELLGAVRELGADAVIVAGPLTGGNAMIRDIGWALEETRTEVILVSSLTNVAGPRISFRPVEGLPLMHVEQPTFDGGRHVLKRGLDIVVAAAALTVLAPVFLVLGLLIRRDSPGGAFFSQTRTGKRGVPFTMYKFRTMHADAEARRAELLALDEGAGPLFKLRDDPRITRIGSVLRRHSLDELPQFWNVLKGDMSLVGPRPPLPEEAAGYAGHEGRRLFIKPGLTGLWQINGRSLLAWDESIRLDLYYVENWSVTGDLQIMWRTFKVMIRPEGAF